jgi:hypothetical protein
VDGRGRHGTRKGDGSSGQERNGEQGTTQALIFADPGRRPCPGGA